MGGVKACLHHDHEQPWVPRAAEIGTRSCSRQSCTKQACQVTATSQFALRQPLRSLESPRRRAAAETARYGKTGARTLRCVTSMATPRGVARAASCRSILRCAPPSRARRGALLFLATRLCVRFGGGSSIPVACASIIRFTLRARVAYATPFFAPFSVCAYFLLYTRGCCATHLRCLRRARGSLYIPYSTTYQAW